MLSQNSLSITNSFLFFIFGICFSLALMPPHTNTKLILFLFQFLLMLLGLLNPAWMKRPDFKGSREVETSTRKCQHLFVGLTSSQISTNNLVVHNSLSAAIGFECQIYFFLLLSVLDFLLYTMEMPVFYIVI